MTVHNSKLVPFISKEELHSRVSDIGNELSEKFKDKVPILIGILNGSFMFMADLMRALTIDCEIDFIKLNSYSGDETTGRIHLIKDISADITGRHVIIVEDIIDSGLTVNFIRKRLFEVSPKSLSIVTLLLKPDVAKLDFKVDIIGFEIPPDFVVGYGLDFNQKLRHLDSIYRLDLI